MLELDRHELTVWSEVSLQTLHDATEADKGMRLVVHNSQNRGGDITHALTVGNLKKEPHLTEEVNA